MVDRNSWRRWGRVLGRDPGSEVDEELRDHIDQRVRDYIARGMDAETARRAALERLGNLDRVRVECTSLLAADRRAGKRRRLVSVSWLDVKLGLRMLVKHPGLSLVGGLGITVGIAISVGFFSFLAAFAYPTLPLDQGERVVALENRDITVNNEEERSLHDFFTWREELKSIEDLTAFRTVQRNLISADGQAELIQVAQITASGFQLARVSPLLGRYLVADDEREGAPPVLVIGYHIWQNRFAGDSAIVGRQVRLGRVLHTVVGVMPEGFAFPESHAFWTPLREQPSAYERREGPEIFIAGRLAGGVTMKAAQAELSAIGERTTAAFPHTHAMIRPMVMPYTHSLTDMQGTTIWEVMQINLVVSIVLVIVALNVAVLVYARTAARHAEITVRSALGASRGRVVMQLFVESFVLSLGAAALGLALAQVGISMGNRIVALEYEVGVPFWTDYSLRPTTVLFALGLALATALVTGVVPALKATGRRLQFDLRQLNNTGMRLGRTWTALIVAQVAIAVGALPMVVNMGWSQVRHAATRWTYPAEEFAVGSLFPEPAPGNRAEADSLLESSSFGFHLSEVIRRLEAEPAVADATFLGSLPGREGMIRVEGQPPPPESSAGHRVASLGVHPSYPKVLGLRLLRGRSLEPSDSVNAVVVTQSFVRRVLGGAEALGRRIRHVSERERTGEVVAERWYQIVGVVEDPATNDVAPELITPIVYYPVGPEQVQEAQLNVRLRGATPADFTRRFRQIVVDVDPTLRLMYVRSLADSREQQQVAARLVALLVGLILLSGLLLSAAGVYAMMSFIVTQRRREIGIRAALGARPRQVLRDVFARAAWQIALGLLVGVAAAAALDRLARGEWLRGGSVVLISAIAILMAIVGLLAALGPAWRGLRIQPTEALKEG